MATSKIASQSPFVARLVQEIRHLQVEPPLSARTVSPPSTPAQTSATPPPRDITMLRLTPEAKAQFEADAKAYADMVFGERDRALALIEQGRFTEAQASLETSFRAHPTDLFSVPLLDLEMDQGDYVSAYKFAAALIKSGNPPESVLLRASLAASTLGEVYPGQREFCEHILTRLELGDSSLIVLPVGDSPEVVAALSHEAIANECMSVGKYAAAVRHLEIALKVDPDNPSTCIALSICLRSVWRYREALTVAQAGLPRATTTYLKTVLKYEILASQEGLKRMAEGKMWEVPPTPTKPSGPSPR